MSVYFGIGIFLGIGDIERNKIDKMYLWSLCFIVGDLKIIYIFI